MRTTGGILLACAIATACGGGGETKGPVATYGVPDEGPMAWGALPFPNDLFLTETGTVELTALPESSPAWEGMRAELNQRRGFCSTCAIHFPIEGAIDAATLAEGAVLLELASGGRIPVEVEWSAVDGLISLRPRRGVVLAAGQHVAALTHQVRDSEGNALRAGDGMRAPRTMAILEPGLTALETAGIPRGSLAAATAFTVDDTSRLTRSIRDAVRATYAANGPPVAVVDRVWRAAGGGLNDLMGVPAEDRPGVDVADVAGGGATAVVHSTLSVVVKGHFSSVRVITGAGSELGTVRRGASGVVEAVAGDDVPFVLTIPSGADVGNLPILVFQHGLTGTLAGTLVFADTAGKAGMAFLALEPFQHGSRAPSGEDTLHDLRETTPVLGPDGFFEHDPLDVALRVLGVVGSPDGRASDGAIVLGSAAQMVADEHALLQLVDGGDFSAIAAADPSLAGLTFDGGRTILGGLSLGTVVGQSVLLSDDTVEAAWFSVPAGSLADAICETPVFRQQAELLIWPSLGVPSGPWEPERDPCMHPLMMLLGWVGNPFEPTANAPLMLSNGVERDYLFQLAGLDEAAGVANGDGLIAALGIPAIGAFEFAEVTPGTAPMAGRGAWRFATADHVMHVTGEGKSEVLPPALPPFQYREEPLLFMNPIAQAHAQLTHFLSTRVTTGRGEIAAPE